MLISMSGGHSKSEAQKKDGGSAAGERKLLFLKVKLKWNKNNMIQFMTWVSDLEKNYQEVSFTPSDLDHGDHGELSYMLPPFIVWLFLQSNQRRLNSL